MRDEILRLDMFLYDIWNSNRRASDAITLQHYIITLYKLRLFTPP